MLWISSDDVMTILYVLWEEPNIAIYCELESLTDESKVNDNLFCHQNKKVARKNKCFQMLSKNSSFLNDNKDIMKMNLRVFLRRSILRYCSKGL